MFTPLISPLELICTVCLLPVVVSVRLAANPEASTKTSIALARDIAAQIEFVAIAGAMEILLQAQSIAVDFVIGLAAEPLGRSVGKQDRSVARPCSVKAGKRTGLGVARRHRQQERGADACGLDGLPKKSGTKLHVSFPFKKDVISPRRRAASK